MSIISIIVPVFKVEKYIHRCIDSILNQTFYDFDLILVDDGSPDKCGNICDEYKVKDSRIQVIHQENGGLSAARNTGIDWAIKHSDSEWISFIDSDDWIHPQYFESLYNAAVKLNQPVSVSNYFETDEEENLPECSNNEGIVFESDDFFSEYRVAATTAWGKIYKKELFTDIRYPVGMVNEDEFVTYKLIFKNNTVAFVNQKMYYYYQNPNGIMRSNWSIKHFESLKAFENQLTFYEEKHYYKTYKTVSSSMAYIMYENIQNAQKYGYDDTIEYKNYLKKFKKYLFKYKIPFKNNSLLYCFAYPFPMKFLYKTYKTIFKSLI